MFQMFTYVGKTVDEKDEEILAQLSPRIQEEAEQCKDKDKDMLFKKVIFVLSCF